MGLYCVNVTNLKLHFSEFPVDVNGIWKGKCKAAAIFILHLENWLQGIKLFAIKTHSHKSPGLPCPCGAAAVPAESPTLTWSSFSFSESWGVCLALWKSGPTFSARHQHHRRWSLGGGEASNGSSPIAWVLAHFYGLQFVLAVTYFVSISTL